MKIEAEPKEDCLQPKVRIDLRPGPTSPAQRQAWKLFWQKVITKAKSEANRV